MTPEEQFVLDTIAQGESPDYQTLYGGHKFHSYAAHPNISIPIGKTGLNSTAAGRYQLLKKTWDAQASELGLKDFSPESQDQAAWNLAQQTYAKKTGRNLNQDAEQKAVDWGALTSQWPSLARLVQPGANAGAVAFAGQAPANPGPEIFSQLPAAQHAPGLTPVDFDPFQPAR